MKEKKEYKLITIGKPSISALSESEQKIFYITLLNHILELYKEENNSKGEMK